jgi:hypothetical protein
LLHYQFSDVWEQLNDGGDESVSRVDGVFEFLFRCDGDVHELETLCDVCVVLHENDDLNDLSDVCVTLHENDDLDDVRVVLHENGDLSDVCVALHIPHGLSHRLD